MFGFGTALCAKQTSKRDPTRHRFQPKSTRLRRSCPGGVGQGGHPTFPTLSVKSQAHGVAVAAVDSVVANPAESRTQSVVTATNAFLDSLSAEQRPKVLFAFALGRTAGVATFKGGLDGRMNFVGEK
jgi:hypothetical protein